MKTSFKYALALAVTILLIGFFTRERFTMYPTSEEPERPEKLLPPYGNVLYTEGGDEVAPAPGGIGNDLPMGNS
jgi:hypothetical protein